MLLFGSFGWRGITKFSRIKVKLVRRLSIPIFGVSEWVIKKNESKGIPLEAINRFWSSVLQGRQSSKIVNRLMWIHPPYVVYKLEFDGSFL